MRVPIFLLSLTILLILFEGTVAKRKHKKFNDRHHRMRKPVSEDMEIMAMMEEDEAAEKKLEAENDRGIYDNNVPLYDPCNEKQCGAGRVCKLTEDGEPYCICIPHCGEETDPRRKVCSNYNSTWGSDCALHQMRCWCESGDERCIDNELIHMHIEYYGDCRNVEDCTEDQMADFPRRMRDWLFNVMRDLADREELSPYYLKMEREAEANYTKRWTNAAIWKWCDLEKSHDRTVSRHELFPIRAHLIAMEHCIAPFLDKCADERHNISLKNWAKCLGIDPEEIEDKCEDIWGDDDDEE